MKNKNRTESNRIIRHFRIRKRVQGNVERPRLSIFRSSKHLEVQIIDDFEQKTLVSATTKSKEFLKEVKKDATKLEQAVALGQHIAKKAKAKQIEKVVFDRGGYLYHGRIKAFADAARNGGLSF